jgi:hypothetical protein
MKFSYCVISWFNWSYFLMIKETTNWCSNIVFVDEFDVIYDRLLNAEEWIIFERRRFIGNDASFNSSPENYFLPLT